MLLRWYEANRRDLPWRRTTDPYRILLSEVMLQQTRVETVLPYYARFLRLFPTAKALAAARPQTVLRAWAGLGYYSRARSLRAAAQSIQRSGFPSTYEGLLDLPGVGRYTAAAVASIAFGLPRAVIDGNVRRLLARLFACQDGFEEKAEALLDRKRPGDFNQAMMELGATVCLPRNPRCSACPLAGRCAAFGSTRVKQFPARRPQAACQTVELRLAVVERGGRILLAPPGTAPLWPGFWSLPELPLPGIRQLDQIGAFRHTVTFRRIKVEVFRASVSAERRLTARGFRFLSHAELDRLPLSTPSRKALRFV